MRFTLDGEPFELTADIVRARVLAHAPEGIHSYWVVIDYVRWPVKQVISVSTGVHGRQRFQSQAARRWLLGLGFVIGGGRQEVSTMAVSARRTSSPKAVELAVDLVARDVVLVGCV